MYEYEGTSVAVIRVVELFSEVLWAVIREPALALFVGVAVLLIVVGVLAHVIRKSRHQ